MIAVTVASLESMSLTELVKLESRISPLIVKKHQEALAAAKTEFASELTHIATKYGLKPTEVVSGNGKHPIVAKAKRRKLMKRKAPIVAKYADPSNPTRTWSGKGPAPRWMKDSGQPKEFFLATK